MKKEKRKRKGLQRAAALLVCLVLGGLGLLVYAPEDAAAATVTGNTVVNGSGKWYVSFSYSITETATKYTVKVTNVTMTRGSHKLGEVGKYATTKLWIGGELVKTVNPTSWVLQEAKSKVVISSFTKTFAKTSAAKNIAITAQIKLNSSSAWAGTSKATTTVTMPKLAPVTLAYNGNGGSGAPAAQTVNKLNPSASQTFTISGTKPVLEGYIFRGWSKDATATAGTYQPGGSISIVSNTTLYAVWEEGLAVGGSITWDDEDDSDGIRPDKIRINLKDSEGEIVKTAEIDSGTGSYEFEGLAEDVYRVSVHGIDSGGAVTSSVSGYTVTMSGYDITLTHEPEKITIAGKVIWNDDSDSYGKRPEACSVYLYRDSASYAGNRVAEEVIDTAEDEDSFSFTVNRNRGGIPIEYILVPQKGFADYAMGREGNTVIYSIRNAASNMDHAFAGCVRLPSALPVTYNVDNVRSTFSGCRMLEGVSIVDCEPSVFENCYGETELDIELGGKCSQDTCSKLMATAGGGNVTCGHTSHTNASVKEENMESPALIPDEALYYDESADEILTAGDELPELSTGDMYRYGDYVYGYGIRYKGEYDEISEEAWNDAALWEEDDCDWSARLLDMENECPGELLTGINGKKLTSVYRAFAGSSIENAPKLPATVTDMRSAFEDCRMLVRLAAIPSEARKVDFACRGCDALSGTIEIRSEVIESYEGCFEGTELNIRLTGVCPPDIMKALAATSQQGNVTW
ncbi:MAG: Cna B-type domain-containing protein [Lentihominibacter sp.]|nr:Cna B-type domain-containing protein [Lentihominibacter sp.]